MPPLMTVASVGRDQDNTSASPLTTVASTVPPFMTVVSVVRVVVVLTVTY